MNALSIFSTAWLAKLSNVFRTVHFLHGEGTTTQSVVNDVTEIQFNTVTDSGGIFDGQKITVPFNGILDLTCMVKFGVAGGNWSVAIYVDGVQQNAISPYELTASNKSGNWKRKLLKNQVVTVRIINNPGTTENSIFYHWISATVTRD